jgi:hypothetical protein
VIPMVRMRWGAVAILGCAVALYGSDKKDKDKVKPAGPQLVDSGSFGVFVKNARVVTETFNVQQENGVSIVKSQLKTGGQPPATQRSELQMTGSADLVRYEWSDGSGSLVVTPKDDFLLEKITTANSSKPAEQPFLMPSTSAILDNNFFIHRELLVWHYLAIAPCGGETSRRQCQPLEFGVLVPQDRTSMRVRMELVGREKVTIRGVERELLRLNLKGEAFSWALWVDDKDQFKLMRVLIADDNTEVVRD